MTSHHPQFKPVAPFQPAAAGKRTAIYARVSSEEQTKGNYPSCESQIEELEAECRRQGGVLCRALKDEGYSAGTMKRPGLTELRWMVKNGEVDVILCTWYDRLTRSRDFYILDNEFRSHGVEFVTIHDATNTRTAAGRFMESMLVAAKTYDREQTGEKVRTKMRMRLEKGLHQGGLVPFGFVCDPATKLLSPNPEQVSVLQQVFQVYVDTASDFAVRDWLKVHHIPSPRDEAVWRVSTICDLLSNRRYIAEIEINRRNKGIEGLPESEAYRVVPAPHEPMVSRELFELAQSLRKQKSHEAGHRRGRPHNFSQNRCDRVFLLQSRLVCGLCGSSMSPYYTIHKPGKDRKRGGFVHYYICANQQMKGREQCGHSNRILANVSEGWIMDKVTQLATAPEMIEEAFGMAKEECQASLLPQQEALLLTRKALDENQTQLDKIVETVTSGSVTRTLLAVLDEKAHILKVEQERLKAEQRRLTSALVPLQDYFETLPLRETLTEFSTLAAGADRAKIQTLIRLVIRRIEWMPDGNHAVEFYQMPKSRHGRIAPHLDLRLESNVRSDGPDRIRTGDLLRDRQAL
jgi:site-specific DNA recombinase